APPDSAALPEVPRLLFAGDPIERAIAADALGAVSQRALQEQTAQRLALLFDVLENDRYPAVRSIAWHALRNLIAADSARALPDFAAFTATDARADRTQALARIRASLPGALLQAEVPAALRALRAEAREQPEIFIGE